MKRLRVSLATCLLLQCVTAVASAQSLPSVEDFRRAPSAERVAFLQGLDRSSALPTLLGPVLTVALSDPEAQVRVAALNALGAQAGMRGDPSAFITLRAATQRLLSDDAREVRLAAIECTASMLYDFSKKGRGFITLPRDVGRSLVSRFRIEQDDRVRGRIVYLIAWSAPTPEFDAEAVALLAAALHDSSSLVLSSALWGVGEYRLTGQLRRTAELLDHQNESVRSCAALALGKTGHDAIDYLPALQAALEHEANALVRGNIESAILQIAQ